MRRLALLVAVGLTAAACGASDPAPSGGQAPEPAPAMQAPAVVLDEPTDAELERREELLAQIESGAYGDCGCTAADRARDRVESGKARAPDPDRLVSNLP